MFLKIWTTPTSITIADNNQNRVSVLKTTSGMEFHSSLANSNVNKELLHLQESIKHRILNPEKDRDSYKVRFSKLADFIKGQHVDTFSRLSELMPI